MAKMTRTKSNRPNVTLKHIADHVGVSVATVSRVLNFDANLVVTDSTRQAIIESAETMKYERRKRHHRTGTNHVRKVALLHFLRPEEELVDPFYIAVRLGIETRCSALRLDLTKLYHTDRMPDSGVLRTVDGLIVIGWHSQDEVEWITAHNPNVVFADFHPPGDSIDSVESDLAAATRKLLGALDQLGYQRIAFAGWYDRFSRNADATPEIRCFIYKSWMEERNRFDPSLLAMGGRNNEKSGYELTLKLLQNEARPEVIVTANDNMAVGAYRAIHERGLQLPDDVALASFNDISSARFMTPPLTTVRLPAETIGENSVDLLTERMAGRELAKRLTIESKIVWRASTRIPPALKLSKQ